MLSRSSLRRGTLAGCATFALAAVALAACKDSSGPGNSVCNVTEPINVGQTISGSLSTTDCRGVGNEFEDHYVFTLTAATDVRVDMTSLAVDTFIKILDSDDEIVDTDDDGGPLPDPDTNSRLDVTLDPGTYRIVATSFFNNETGAYQLSLLVNPGT